MSETPDNANPFASVTWPESYPDACQSEDNGAPAITTLPQHTTAENAVSGAKQARDALNQFAESWSPVIAKLDAKIDEDGPWGPFANEETRKKMEANGKKLAEKLLCDAPATGTEALVCADIAKRQRRGLAKYGKTVIGNPLSFAQWLQHFYEELLDGAIYAKRILTMMNHEPENEKQPQDDTGAAGVLHRDPASHHGVSDAVPLRASAGAGHDRNLCPGPVARHRKPGAGRKPKPCPNCGATKSIGSTVKNGIPTRRCRQCGHVVQTYPHLANVKASAEMA